MLNEAFSNLRTSIGEHSIVSKPPSDAREKIEQVAVSFDDGEKLR